MAGGALGQDAADAGRTVLSFRSVSGVMRYRSIFLLPFLLFSLNLSLPSAHAQIVVNSTGQDGDGDLGDGICDTGFGQNLTGECTFQAALDEANARPGADVIHFNIPGTGPHVIQSASFSDFTISETVEIDGYTQPGAVPNTNPAPEGLNAQPMIVLSNTGFGPSIIINAPGTVIRGLVFQNFGPQNFQTALISFAENVRIEGCFFGTDATGTVAVPSYQGLQISGAGSVIGGTDPAARNLISGNAGTGLLITEDAPGTVVQGNLIGTDITGTQALGNAGNGLSIDADNVVVGGTDPGAPNVISANGGGGINISSTADNVVVQGNLIGTDVTGTQPLGNNRYGLGISGTGHQIGGADPGAANVIAATTSGHGIQITRGLIDSPDPTGVIIEGNLIGLNRQGSLDIPLGNGGDGIWIQDAAGITIRNNTIAHNDGNGVLLRDFGASSPRGVEITENSIYANGELGIELGGDGVTPNDSLDVDDGPNDFQNFPVITSVSGDAVEGTLHSEPNQTYRIEFFENDERDPSGFGEGKTFAGALEVTTDAGGDASFSHTLNFEAENVTATATNLATGNTSEFSGIPVFTVNATGDAPDMNPGDAICDTGHTITRDGESEPECTLRAAIEEANAYTMPPVAIHFDIPTDDDPGCDGDGVCVIQPKTSLPSVQSQITINGYTQPGAEPATKTINKPPNTKLKIVLDGVEVSSVEPVPIGIHLAGNQSEVRGLNIRGFWNADTDDGSGVFTTGNENRVTGCFIGTDVTGTEATPLTFNGVGVLVGDPFFFPENRDNVIGEDDFNLISGNNLANIVLTGSGHRVVANYIGVDATGEVALNNVPGVGGGVEVAGDDMVITDNWISGHKGTGIDITGGERIVVARNGIGLSLSEKPLGNGKEGILVNNAKDVLIGVDPNGSLFGDGNGIAYNQGNGVTVESGDNVFISENAIYENGLLGIDLKGDGPTPNDPQDADTGPNGLQNAPAITGVTVSGTQTTITGTLESTPNGFFGIDVYENEAPDDSGYGEGQTYVGTTTVTTDAMGEADFTLVVDMALTGFITATATNLGVPFPYESVEGGPTSEFSPAWVVGGLEFGDAPETGSDEDPVPHGYPTKLASDGARHEAVFSIRLGDRLDPETEGKPTILVDGDDLDAGDDDDGLLFETPHIFPHPVLGPGTQPIPVLAPGSHSLIALNTVSGYLNVWVDFNRDGDWDDPDEHVVDEVFVSTGPVRPKVPFTVPAVVDFGLSALRARFTTVVDAANTVTGIAPDGEVEDYLVQLLPGGTAIDYGDAPDDRDAPRYPTLLGATVTPPAAHIMSELLLGEKVDGETDGQPDDDATGDGDDDDGVTFTTPLLPGQTASVEVTVTNTTTPGGGYLNAWLDFNRDDDWDDAGEQIITDELLAPGTHVLTFSVPDTATTGKTYARFRLDPQGGLGPAGLVFGGEVEDYAVTVGTATPVEPEEAPPATSRLYPNYPNPFARQTTIPYDVAAAVHVRLELFDLLGRRRATLVDAPRAPGRYEARLDVAGLPAGVYVVRLTAGDFRAHRTLTVVR